MPPRPAIPSIRQPAKTPPVWSSGTAMSVRCGPMAAITFAGGTLDRVSERRTDEAWVQAAREDPRARAVAGGPGGVALDADGAPLLVALDGREGILLGLGADGTPLWAI